MRKRQRVALLCLSSWCLVIAVWLSLTMPRVCLQFVIVFFSDHTHFLFFHVLYRNDVMSTEGRYEHLASSQEKAVTNLPLLQ